MYRVKLKKKMIDYHRNINNTSANKGDYCFIIGLIFSVSIFKRFILLGKC